MTSGVGHVGLLICRKSLDKRLKVLGNPPAEQWGVALSVTFVSGYLIFNEERTTEKKDSKSF